MKPKKKVKRPRGFKDNRQWKASNKRLLADFNGLAWMYIRRFQSVYEVSDTDCNDLFSALMAELMKLPDSYRNGAGMNIAIRSKLSTLIKDVVAIKTTECQAGTSQEGKDEEFKADSSSFTKSIDRQTTYKGKVKNVKKYETFEEFYAIWLGKQKLTDSVRNRAAGEQAWDDLKSAKFEKVPDTKHTSVIDDCNDWLDVQSISSHVKQLPSGEKLVMELMYGLNGSKQWSRPWIAKKLGKTKQWVHSKHLDAVDRLREVMNINSSLATS